MPATPTEEALQRLVGGLNSDYDVGIRAPGPLLSPSKRRGLPRTEAQERGDQIYLKIRHLHFEHSEHLSACIGRFHTESRQLLAESASDPAGGALTLRASLQHCLLAILSGPAIPPRPKQPKRSLDQFFDPRVKRPRSRGDDTFHGDVGVDSIPVRSSTRQSALSSSDTHSSSPSRTILTYFSRSCSKAPPISSVRQSFGSQASSLGGAFGPDGNQTAQTTGHTSLSDDPSADDLYPITQEHEAFIESFCQFLPRASGLDLGLPTAESQPQVKSRVPQTMQQRLKSVWPKLPLPGPNDPEAPLAVIWEVTRMAQHCGVNPIDCNLKYEPNDKWRDQSKLRAMFAFQNSVLGKDLPHASDAQAWMAALDTFEFNGKAVMLRGDLISRQTADGPLFDFCLHPLGLQQSNRLQRRFGADRFLEVTIPSLADTNDQPAACKDNKANLEDIVRWLTKEPHYFLRRRWAAFSIRDAKQTLQTKTVYRKRVYFFACDGDHFRPPLPHDSFPPLEEALLPSCRTKCKLSGLLEWAISLTKNSEQQVPKLFSRIALNLSLTFPSVTLETHQIRHRDKDLGTHSVMNDGIGRMSRSLAKKISNCLGLGDIPAGYQGRMGSAKGIWIIDVDDDGLDDDDWIETYPSQRKWACDFQDPHHRTFEVKDWPREPKSKALNKQFIPLLEAQAVRPQLMRQTIADYLANGLRADLDAQRAATDHAVDFRLWLQQVSQSKSAALFHGYIPFLGGLPKSDEEAIAYLLDSGFDYRELTYLRDLIWKLADRKVELLEKKMNIKVPQSTYMFMVADFTSSLEENEVHVSFSSKFQVDGFSDTLLENMDILVARSPAHLPSDIQRVRVVSHPRLRKLKDVIVFSTKGQVPLADKLSGGDYDGDRAWVCWDSKIVTNFRNAPVPPAEDLVERGILKRLNLTVEGLKTPEPNVDVCDEFVYVAFGFNMQKSWLGICTNYKEELCRQKGAISSTAVVTLSNLLGCLVDQSKQGFFFDEDDWRSIRELIKEPDDKSRASARSRRSVERHILEFLEVEVAKEVIDEALKTFKLATDWESTQQFDPDLTRMYNDFGERNSGDFESAQELLKQLREDLEAVSQAWAMKVGNGKRDGDYVAKVKELYRQWLDIKPRGAHASSELVRQLVEPWIKDPLWSRWALLKASATFSVYHRNKPSFVWRMAGRQLCLLKSMARPVVGETAPAVIQPEMYAALGPDKRFIRARVAQRGTTRDGGSMTAMEEATCTEYDDDWCVVDDDA